MKNKLFLQKYMNIYKVTRISLWDYDTYSSFICFANNEEQAKNLNPSFANIYTKHFNKYLNDQNEFKSLFINWNNDKRDKWVKYTWVKNIDDLTVIKLGTSDNNQQIGVILSSFHAG